MAKKQQFIHCETHFFHSGANANADFKGFPGSPVLKNPHANAGDTGSSLIREDPTCLGAAEPKRHNCWADALQPGSHSYLPTCSNYWSPHTLEPAFCNQRCHCDEKPMYHNQRKPWDNNQFPVWPKIISKSLFVSVCVCFFLKLTLARGSTGQDTWGNILPGGSASSGFWLYVEMSVFSDATRRLGQGKNKH